MITICAAFFYATSLSRSSKAFIGGTLLLIHLIENYNEIVLNNVGLGRTLSVGYIDLVVGMFPMGEQQKLRQNY
jgi:hypothetical protein